jgi:hypothetical protein
VNRDTRTRAYASMSGPPHAMLGHGTCQRWTTTYSYTHTGMTCNHAYGLEHGTTRDRGSSERIWVERAREKRIGEFIEPGGRGNDSVISLFLLIKLITNYNASRSQPSQLILCSKPSCYYFTALVEYDMYSPL